MAPHLVTAKLYLPIMTSTTRKRLAWLGIAAVTAGFLILQTFPHLKKDLYNWINPEEEDKEEEEEKEKEEIVPEQKQEPKKSTKETKPVVNRNAESPKQELVALALPGRTARMIIPQQVRINQQ